jgi:hypothetical protein
MNEREICMDSLCSVNGEPKNSFGICLRANGDDLWRASANAEESEANALASKTSRALGNEYAGDIQFPHREEWEGRLDTHKVALVSALRELIKAR